jgi:hypothetical protein
VRHLRGWGGVTRHAVGTPRGCETSVGQVGLWGSSAPPCADGVELPVTLPARCAVARPPSGRSVCGGRVRHPARMGWSYPSRCRRSQVRCPDPHSFSHACLLTIAVADLSQAANREFLPNRSLQARSDTRSGCFRSELSPARRFRVPDANGRSQYPAKGSACLAGVALAPRSSKCADLSAGDFYSKRFLTCSLGRWQRPSWKIRSIASQIGLGAWRVDDFYCVHA